MTVRPSTPEENAAHRAGVCVDCREKPHSAGRNRCDTCHDAYTARGMQR